MTSSLKERLLSELQESMRKRDDVRRSVIRLVRAGIVNAEIEKGKPLDDESVIAVIQKEVKQRRESIAEFAKGNRKDLVAKEEAELAILKEYLPKQLSREELTALAKQVIAEVGAKGPQDKGKVMGRLMGQVRGRADGQEVNQVVTALLAQS